MGYVTNFEGEFGLSKEIDEKTRRLINNINEDGIILGNDNPDTWCLWQTDGKVLYSSSGNAYDFEEWLRIIVEEIIVPRGYVLNGEVEWIGDDPDDRGKVVIKDNEIKYKLARIEWVDA